MADALAGFIYAGGAIGDWRAGLGLVAASSCMYAGGVALNDVFDAGRDAMERAVRPIPSGRTAKSHATILSIGLLALGVALAFLVSPRSGAVALALVAAIVLYDGLLKATAAAPAMMGACRGLNLALGMSLAVTLPVTTWLIPVALMWLYVMSITLFARKEAIGGGTGRLTIGTCGVAGAVLGLGAIAAVVPTAGPSYLGFAGVLLVVVAVRGVRAARNPSPQHVQRAVKAFVLGIILFDACLAASAQGPVAGLLVAALLLPATGLARLFRVT